MPRWLKGTRLASVVPVAAARVAIQSSVTRLTDECIIGPEALVGLCAVVAGVDDVGRFCVGRGSVHLIEDLGNRCNLSL